MKMTEWARRALAWRREEKRMRDLGYRRHETDWEIVRGFGRTSEVILDAKISCDGKGVWTLIGHKSP